ncbi:MAG TPA: NAD-glutamate dehydrogenase domain-containing protein [Rhabdochlamydiaceae bacterium]|jgi:glutamate dehydrogenase|nr:NAD-glutamate dehydrogenase domain-containing protein [Rhabdochlamydiaceae bacterium]
MTAPRKPDLQAAIVRESKKFEQNYIWVESHLPPSFFEDADSETVIMVAHSLMDFDVQDFFSHIHLKNKAITLCLDSADADLQILRHYRNKGIKNYRTFVSNVPPPFIGISANLRVAVIYFTEAQEEKEEAPDKYKDVYPEVKKRNPNVTEAEFSKLLTTMNTRFLRSLTKERLILAFDVLFRAKLRDPCQIEVVRNQDWKKDVPSLQIVLAWRNVPKFDFLYRLTKVILRHGLALKRMAATYVDPYSKNNVLVMSLGLHGAQGKAAWEEADIADFLQELVTVKYFPVQEIIETSFVDNKLVRGNIGNLIKTMVHFIHQMLVHADPNLYSFQNIEEGMCRHVELTVKLTKAFEAKFHPEKSDLNIFNQIKNEYLSLVEKIDTGQEANDNRRRNILKQGMNFVEYMLKTNFYRPNKTAFSFRLDPHYLDNVPYNRVEKFPELPFAVFFMKGMYFIGFHIRFRDLARGGLRTVCPERIEQLVAERNNVFAECYNLAYTQQKKNKDIPEGGAKGVILLEPYERIRVEEEIYKHELEIGGVKEIEEKIKAYHQEQKLEYLYQAQRSYVESFVTIVNCEADGKLRVKSVIDYYKKPEYIYLGPDENMHNDMIVWICNYAKKYNYKPGLSFMSSKPGAGINHKEYGVTSRGVNIYMEETLQFLGIDPKKNPFTIKMTGGPDGDVAGNEMNNLYVFYPNTAKLLATIDVSGTIFDPQGLDLAIIAELFKEGKPLRFYPPEKLSDGGFILDTKTRREQSGYVQQTLLQRKQNGKVIQEWISGNDMNHLLRTNVHQVKADVFVPGGGRPRTLNENNYRDFLDVSGKPTSKAIIEGGNLYLSPAARRALEKLGVIVIKDSSANKGGVICSSFEVLSGLVLSEEEFMKEKPALVSDIIAIIENRSRDEARALLAAQGQAFLTDVSEWISERINAYTDELMAYLAPKILSNDPNDPLTQCLLNYCPATLRNKYQERILKEVPDIHKKAIIACFLAQRLVYRKGLSWSPSIVDVLPLIINDHFIIGP